MLRRFSHILGLLAVAGFIFGGCKTATDPGNTNTTHIDIGDTIPKRLSSYAYDRYLLDNSGVINPTTFQNYGTSFIDSVGITYQGKSNVFFLHDNGPDAGSNGDSTYYAYETSSDVSIYLQNPGFLKNTAHANQLDETLQTIADLVFHNWIRLPIATKDSNITAYNVSNLKIDVSGTQYPADILAKVDYINDSTITTKGNPLTPLLSKHCRISISATLHLTTTLSMTHVRDIWFVPKIGAIALEKVKTYVPFNGILDIPLDTTNTLKVLNKFDVK